MKIRCLIVDDEPLAADILEKYINKIPYLELVNKCEDAIEANEFLAKSTIDLIFLDINMPAIDGVTFAKSIKGKYQIIFTTAYPEYAVEGFSIEALDYLLKPIRFERFEQAVLKARGKHTIDKVSPNYIIVKTDKIEHKVALDSIYYIEGFGDFVKIHLLKKVLIGSGSIGHWQTQLPGDSFIRTHKSYITNMDQVLKKSSNTLITEAGNIPVGQAYKHNVQAKFNG